MNKQELIEYCESLKGNLNKFINGIDVNKIIAKIEQLDEPEKVTVPQFVVDFITEQKNLGHTLSYSIDACMSDGVAEWYWDNSELFALSWVNGYTVEKEKRYRVSLKNGQPLLKAYSGKALYFSQDIAIERCKVTRKELDQAGFAWVLDCPGIEIEEVEE